MDNNFVKRVSQCIAELGGHSEQGIKTITAQQIWAKLQSDYAQYRRCRNNVYINSIDSFLRKYKEQSDAIQLTSIPTKRKRREIPLRVVKHDQLKSEFVCECSFLPRANSEFVEFLGYTDESSNGGVDQCNRQHVMQVSGSDGSGKHCLVEWMCRKLEIDIVYIDPGLDLDDHFVKILDMLEKRVILLLYQISNADEYLISKRSYSRNAKIVSLFRRLVFELRAAGPEAKARIVCLCSDASALDESIRMLMKCEIKVPLPGPKCRLAILKSLLPQYTFPWVHNLLSYTSSFLPAHLNRLVDSAFRRQKIRLPGGHIELCDFENALLSASTVHNNGNFLTALCTNAVQVPETSWADVGALDHVRKILERQIMLQCKCLGVAAGGNQNRLDAVRSLLKPTGVLLVGPPGCGKTLIGKAIANELSMNFLAVNGPELLSMYVGESERSVRKLFQDASNFSPCLIFFDEIDALCTRRRDGGSNGNHEGPLVLQQLLAEMDGIRGRRGVFLMAATNVLDVIDPAITRPGRFGTLVYIGPPNLVGRRDILQRLLKEKADVSNVCIDQVSASTDHYTGADLEDLLRVSALHAIERTDNDSVVKITDEDLLYALSESRASLSIEQVTRYEETQRHRCCNSNTFEE